MATIVCTGLACLDYLFRIPSLPKGGGKYFADTFVAAAGGPAAAAALGVASLGHRPVFIGRLGNDQVGQEVVRLLSRRGVDTSHVRMVDGQSSQVSAVMVDHGGERQIVNHSNKNLDSDPRWIPEDVIAGADFLLSDVRWPEGNARALELARKHGVRSLIDADIAPVDITGLASLADYVVCSAKGLESISGPSGDVKTALLHAKERLGSWVAVTAGEKGSFWIEDGKLKNSPAEQIVPVDTCCAGDIFHGAFAVAITEQMTIGEAMRFAGAAAAVKCLTFGGSAGAPNRQEVDELLGY